MEEMRRCVRLRVFVSQASASGPRTLKLCDSQLADAELDDWIRFEDGALPLAETVSATLQTERHRAELNAIQLKIHPWVKLSDGHVDELMTRRDRVEDRGSEALFTEAMVGYLEHLAAW